MESERFFERYTISRSPEGKPEETGRAGAAIIYKAVDEQSKQAVILQLVPLAAIDPTRRDELEARATAVCKVDHVNMARVFDAGVQHGYFAFVTQYLPGETTDGWIVANGPMTPDAVIRIGMQVVRATAAAAFHGLTHRAIQPSNIVILPGESPSGGWPFIKVLNLGVAALELHGESNDARELAQAIVPQFASPEQIRNQQIDFRSGMYSLGATMCFLLTGAVPLPESGDTNARRRGRRRLPELASMPKSVRRLLGSMLAEDPADRPLDPIALERYMASILSEIERRQEWSRKFGIPLAANVQRKIVRSRSPFAQVARGTLAVAALLIALAAIGAILYPRYFHRTQSIEEIGVPVGVPVAGQTTVAPVATSASPANIVAKPDVSPSEEQTQPPAIAQASPAPSTSLVQAKSNSQGVTPSVSPADAISNLQSTGHPSISPIQSARVAEASLAASNSFSQNARPGNAPAPADGKITPPPSSSTLANVDSLPQRPAGSPTAQPSRPSVAKAASASENSVARRSPPNHSIPSANEKPGSSSKTLTADAHPDSSASTDSEPEPDPPSYGPEDEDEAPPVGHSNLSRKIEPRLTTRSKTKSVARGDVQTRPRRSGQWSHAIFIGVTPMGKLLFRLPSGKIVALPPRHRRAPVATRPRGNYGPPPYGYVPPGSDY